MWAWVELVMGREGCWKGLIRGRKGKREVEDERKRGFWGRFWCCGEGIGEGFGEVGREGGDIKREHW